VVATAVAGLALSGCTATERRGFLPEGVTTDKDVVTNLWVNSWIAALAVGALVWGLIIFCVVAYRRRKDDDTIPVQLRYNLPIEILYSVIPLFMIGALFYYTARDETTLIKVSDNPNNVVNIVGKRWAWDFNYLSDNVYEATVQTPVTPSGVDQAAAPVLYLPVDKSTQFVLTSRDVIHSFWVPAFLMKMDMLPGLVNTFQVTPTEIGTYSGKCAELCGTYHSQMLFSVKVVSQADYDQHMADLKAKGQTGLLPNSLSLEQLQPGQAEKIPNVGGQ
jgi:cytochrome c oxidase subunit 2